MGQRSRDEHNSLRLRHNWSELEQNLPKIEHNSAKLRHNTLELEQNNKISPYILLADVGDAIKAI